MFWNLEKRNKILQEMALLWLRDHAIEASKPPYFAEFELYPRAHCWPLCCDEMAPLIANGKIFSLRDRVIPKGGLLG